MSHLVALGVTLVSVFLTVVHSAFDLNTVPSRSIPLYGPHPLYPVLCQWTCWLLLCCGVVNNALRTLGRVYLFDFFFFFS